MRDEGEVMAVGQFPSTLPDGWTPVCSSCNVFLCWDISNDEYMECPSFWESWICRDCNGGVAMSRKNWEQWSVANGRAK